MTETAKKVLDKYQVRKTEKQKKQFREFAVSKASALGYNATIEKGKFGAKNIIIGDPDSAKVIFTAHYDTAPRLPFPNLVTPKNMGLYILYNLAIVLPLLALMFGLWFCLDLGMEYIFSKHPIDEEIYDIINRFGHLLVVILIYLPIFSGPANKHTANDNTSGVITLLDLMAAMPEEERSKAAFVFFDLEEMGLIGSASFAKKHKNIRDRGLIVNFDCVSDGDNFIFAVPKKCPELIPLFQRVYASEDFNVEALSKVFYPSDQKAFKRGVGVAALKKTKGGTLYMNRIHTGKDIIFQEENIEYLVNASVLLTQEL